MTLNALLRLFYRRLFYFAQKFWGLAQIIPEWSKIEQILVFI